MSTRITLNEGYDADQLWSPDGRWLAFASDRGGHIAIYRKRADGSGEPPEMFQQSEFLVTNPAFSPNGRFIAYTSGESGQLEIYVRGYPSGGKWQVSDGGGSQPAWSADGRYIYYRTEEGLAQAAVSERDSGLTVERSEVLFTGPFHGGVQGVLAAGFVFPDFDAARDGSRFVMLQTDREVASSGERVSFVTGWFQELEALAPRNR